MLDITNLKKTNTASQSADIQAFTAKIKKFEQLHNDISAKWDGLTAKLDQANKTISLVEQNWDKKIKSIKIPDINKLDLIHNPTFESFGNVIESKITEMETQFTKIEKLLELKLKDINKKVEENSQSIKQTKESTSNDFVTVSMMNVLFASIDKKINDINEQSSKNVKTSINKFENSQNTSIIELEKKIKAIKIPDVDKMNFVTKQVLESSFTSINKKVNDNETLIKKSEQDQNKAIKELDKRIKEIKIPDIDQSKFITVTSMDTMIASINKKIGEIQGEFKKSEQFQTKSINDLDKRIKGIKVPEIEKLNFASSSMFEAFVHEVEKKITEMDDLMAKNEQTQSKSIKDLDKKIKDIKIPDLEKLNFASSSMLETFVHEVEKKITEMEDQMQKTNQTQSKFMKDSEKKFKESNVIDIDKLKIVTTPVLETLTITINKKIDKFDNQITKSEQNQMKSLMDLDKRIKSIKVPDLEKLNFASSSMLEAFVHEVEKKITEIDDKIVKNDQTQNKLIKDLDKRIKDIKVPEIEKLNFASSSMFEAFVHEVEKKITEMDDLMAKNEQTQSKNYKDLDKKIKDIKLPDLDKLNFASSSMLEAFAHELEKKITEMDDQMQKTNQTQSKNYKDLDKRIKDIKVPELDKLNFASSSMLEAFAHELEKKITEMDDQMIKTTQTQSKSFKELENKINQIKAQDQDKSKLATIQMINTLTESTDKKINALDNQIKKSEQSQIKLIKDLETKIQKTNSQEFDKNDLVTISMIDALVVQMDKKVDEIELTQNKVFNELGKKFNGRKVFHNLYRYSRQFCESKRIKRNWKYS